MKTLENTNCQRQTFIVNTEIQWETLLVRATK